MAYWAIDGSWLVWSGYRHGWRGAEWKPGVIYLYTTALALMVGGTLRFKWKFGILSALPDRMLKSEQAELDLLNETTSERRAEKFTRAEILKIKREYYGRMGNCVFLFLFLIGSTIISWLIQFES